MQDFRTGGWQTAAYNLAGEGDGQMGGSDTIIWQNSIFADGRNWYWQIKKLVWQIEGARTGRCRIWHCKWHDVVSANARIWHW
jgi:hypothetical protein